MEWKSRLFYYHIFITSSRFKSQPRSSMCPLENFRASVGNVGRECWRRWPDKVKSVRRETGSDCNILRKYFDAAMWLSIRDQNTLNQTLKRVGLVFFWVRACEFELTNKNTFFYKHFGLCMAVVWCHWSISVLCWLLLLMRLRVHNHKKMRNFSSQSQRNKRKAMTLRRKNCGFWMSWRGMTL